MLEFQAIAADSSLLCDNVLRSVGADIRAIQIQSGRRPNWDYVGKRLHLIV